MPIEALLVPAVLAHRRRWFVIGLWVSIGSAVGAAVFAWLTTLYGIAFVEAVSRGATHGKLWQDVEHFVGTHGWWGLALVSASPFPQHPAVAIAGLARMKPLVVLIAVFVGRFGKYELIAWAASHSPRLLNKLHLKFTQSR